MLTAAYEHSRSNTDKLLLLVQMLLPEKLETFSAFFIAFLESYLNFEDFEQKDEPHGLSIAEIIHSERPVYLHFTYIHKRSCF